MRREKIMIRVSDDEKLLIDRKAEAQGLPTSSWGRMQLLRAAQEAMVRDTRTPPKPGGPQLLSLFCGPGGLDEGFRQAGLRTALAFDNDEECVRTFALNHPESQAFVRDVTQLTIDELDSLYGQTFAPTGVIGGPPCQSFSVSNVHQFEEDPRHRLPEAYASLLSNLNARSPISFFVFENVPGLMGNRHIHRYRKFKALFRTAGFHLYEAVLDAKHYGVPQERERIIIVGINRTLHPDCVWTPPKKDARIVTVREAIAGLPEPVRNAPGLDSATFPVHPNHWCLVPRSSKFAEARLEEGQMFGRSFRTLCWDKPSWTVAYGHREVHVHPNGHRRLSIYEAMRLQTFPEHYRLTGNMSAQIRLISEAVPPRLAYRIAQSVLEALGMVVKV